MLIGLTGGSGTGKSLVAREFEKNNIEIIDCDLLARKVTEPKSPSLTAIAKAFGDEYINENGELIRKKLGSLVFSDKNALNKLNEILNEYIREELNLAIANASSPIICLDAPLLFEYSLDGICDYVVSVLADKSLRLKRIVSRDFITIEDAENRVNSQPNDEFYLEKSDFVIYNNGTLNELSLEAKKIIEQLRKEL